MNYRDPKLLRHIASLPCMLQLDGCERGPCVAAHANWAEYGKGKGIKAHDLYAVAACMACHHELDQGKRMSREERRDAWERAWRRTMLALFESGRVKVW